jgi:hypothetical protein
MIAKIETWGNVFEREISRSIHAGIAALGLRNEIRKEFVQRTWCQCQNLPTGLLRRLSRLWKSKDLMRISLDPKGQLFELHVLLATNEFMRIGCGSQYMEEEYSGETIRFNVVVAL